MTSDRGAPGRDAQVRHAAAAFARPTGWKSAFQLLTSFGPFLAGCAAMYLVYPVSDLLTLALAVPTGALFLTLWDEQRGRLTRFRDARA
jgi:fatty acid desaturase